MISRERAEIVALGALSWLAEAELLDTFLSSSGADLETVRAAAHQPEMLAAVLDFVMMDDDWVRGVCTAQDLPYEALLHARAALPGGDVPHWT